jgi:hypothetical protein
MLRIPHCVYSRLIDGSEVVSLMFQMHFTPQKHYFFLHFNGNYLQIVRSMLNIIIWISLYARRVIKTNLEVYIMAQRPAHSFKIFISTCL